MFGEFTVEEWSGVRRREEVGPGSGVTDIGVNTGSPAWTENICRTRGFSVRSRGRG